MLKVPELTLGELERSVLETLWREGPMAPGAVHAALKSDRTISVNTVSSALKRLVDKGMLSRRKVSHSYVYEAIVSRAELQRQLLSAIAQQFGEGPTFLAAFVDLAQERGEVEELEALIAARAESEDSP